MPQWYAIKCRRETATRDWLESQGAETYLPAAMVVGADGRRRHKPLIAKLVFANVEPTEALRLEQTARQGGAPVPPIWIYRDDPASAPTPIADAEMRLFRLLTSDDPDARCEVYRKELPALGQRVRVAAGLFAGYEGIVRRIRDNRHVVVAIEGLCSVALPFIHPALLEPLR